VDPEEIRKQRDALERLCALTSEYAPCLRCSKSNTRRLTFASKLIDVAQSTNTDEEGYTKLQTDYQRLFRERFASASSTHSLKLHHHEEDVEERRPSSDSTLTDETETTWLAHIVQEDGKDILHWKTSGQPGALSVQFDDVLGPTGNNGKSPRLLY